jgi:hypothetical protein
MWFVGSKICGSFRLPFFHPIEPDEPASSNNASQPKCLAQVQPPQSSTQPKHQSKPQPQP